MSLRFSVLKVYEICRRIAEKVRVLLGTVKTLQMQIEALTVLLKVILQSIFAASRAITVY